MEHWDLDFEQTLAESESLLKSTARSMDDASDYSLDSILAEFGGESTPHEAASPEEILAAAMPDEPENQPETALQDTAEAMSLQDVLEKTVQTVIAEQEHEPVIAEKPRRGLFSRKRMRDTEELYTRVGNEDKTEEAEDEEEIAPELPEPSYSEAVSNVRAEMRRAKKALLPVGLIAALMWAYQFLALLELIPAQYLADPLISVLPYFALEALACVFGRSIFIKAWEDKKRFSYAVPTALACIVTLADTALCYVQPARAHGASPLHAVAVLALLGALLGAYSLARGRYATFRIAELGDPPYIVTITAGGAAKRSGSEAGFYNAAMGEDISARAQRVLLPVITCAAFVFAVLSTVEQQDASAFLWNFSALLCAAGTLSLPLCYALPFRRLSARLYKSGCALAGYVGAGAIRSSNCVILTDGDLFPPGTITLNGLKVFGEESGKVISYAATMAHAADTGLSPLFDNLLMSDGGKVQPLNDLSFYEEGGISGMIHGETVLFGTLTFFRKKGIALPGDIRLQTGVYLAVDGTLIAVFAVKYMAAENVDWAIHALNRSRITPVLAVRDGNITPALLKRKFKTDAHAVVPKLSTRLALSERSGGTPYALIYREGLMPYAEVTLGSKRLHKSVRIGTALSMLGSIAGTLLAFYLTFIGAYGALTRVNMLLFLGLWALAALIDGLFVDRY